MTKRTLQTWPRARAAGRAFGSFFFQLRVWCVHHLCLFVTTHSIVCITQVARRAAHGPKSPEAEQEVAI